MADKNSLTERDICSKYITPAVTGAGWDLHSQIREEVFFTKGRIIVRGKLHSRGAINSKLASPKPINCSRSWQMWWLKKLWRNYQRELL